MIGNFLKSTILSKILVAVTGAILILFIISHTLGNLLIYAGPEVLNAYGAGLRKLGAFLWVARIGILFAAIIHIVATIRLTIYNKTAKPVNYTVSGYVNSTFSSRTMAVMGLTLLAFIIYHLMHYTLFVTNPEFSTEAFTKYTLVNGENAHNIYKMMITGFQNPLISTFYIIAMCGLGFHLNHGVKSLFHTLGISGPVFTPKVAQIGFMFSVLLSLALISIPVSVLLGFVKEVSK